LLSGLVLPALLLATLTGLATLLLAALSGLVLATLLTTLVLLATLLLLVLVIWIWIVHRRLPSWLISVVKINRRTSRFVPWVI
jgi:hypothetical protein